MTRMHSVGELTSAEEFERLLESDEPKDRERARFGAGSTTFWINVIAQRPHLKVWVVRNKLVPLEVLEVLASDGDDSVRREVAGKRKLTRQLLERLSRDASETVRAGIAYNASTPRDILFGLCSDSSEFVRLAAQDRFNGSEP